ncbi:MAG: acetylglutamate kinase [Ekhidna sp.]|nr:acetylglutamate kinase [Ekhidna sp.]MBC6408887.1 acetylglutamate kinase [Ekhidna sp.]MBC6426523.1 acetylglutamate kinase [Ekhidna sp.]
MKEKLIIVKIGGAIIENDARLAGFLDAFVELHGKKLLVHGGGKIAKQLASSLGIETRMVEGRRITDDQMIDVVVMTYAGLINKKLVALLSAKGIKSIGLTGADGNSIKAHKRPIKNGLDFGWVGDIETVNSNFLSMLIAENLVPVMAPLTHNETGRLLNTNADTIASEIAIALTQQFEVSLNFIFDHKGVMKNINDPDSLLRSIDKSNYEVLKKEKAITNGMIPKIENALRTIEEGVSKVRILNTSALLQSQNPDFNEYTTIH